MITKEQFLGLDPEKHVVVDSYGREWKVLSNAPTDWRVSDVPGPCEVILDTGDEEPWLLGWAENWGGKIVDEEWAIVIELNHKDACVKEIEPS